MAETKVDTYGNAVSDDRELLRAIATQTKFQIDDKKSFSLPTDEDFMIDSISPEVMKKVTETLGNNSAPTGPMFYVDNNLYSPNPGVYEEASVIVVRATPIFPGYGSQLNQWNGDRAKKLNQIDGDTVYFTTENLEDGSQPIKIGETEYSNFRAYLQGNVVMSNVKDGRFGLRFLGINTPEIPHYEAIIDDPDLKRQKFRIGDIADKKQGTLEFRWDKTIIRTPDTEVEFVLMGGSYGEYWTEIIEHNYRDAYIENTPELKEQKFLKVVFGDESIPGNEQYFEGGRNARDAVRELLTGAEDVVLMIDHKGISRKSGQYPSEYEDAYAENFGNMVFHPWDGLKRLYEKFFGPEGLKYLGYNTFGQDAHKRFLGTMYVKKSLPEFAGESVWINASKYVMSRGGLQVTALPDYTDQPTKNKDYSYNSDAFKLWSYHVKGEKVVDALLLKSKEDLDDRRRIQKQITGVNFDAMRDYTVMIGDCLFMVPPTSIRVVTQTTAEKTPILRSRGSMMKSSPKSERLIEMHLYFNNEAGVNGIPTVDASGKSYITLPNGEPITYYMNGLRQLVSMFKLTPFLPVENHYLNDVLNIEAVSLVNIQISTTPGYPRCLAAVLTLEEFNYHIYMPEIPIPSAENGDPLNLNLFAATIDYELMRWHYQQPIIRGERLADLEFDSEEYLAESFGSKTALQPMQFKSSNVEFFVINKDYLDQQKQLKMEAISRPIMTQPQVTEGAKEWARQLSYVYERMTGLSKLPEFQSALAKINEKVGDDVLMYNFDPGTSHNQRDRYTRNAGNRLNKTLLFKGHHGKAMNSGVAFSDILYKDIMTYSDALYTVVQNHLGNYVDEIVLTEDYISRDHDGTVKWHFDLGVSTSSIGNESDMKNFMKIMTQEMDMTQDQFFVDGRVRVTVSGIFKDIEVDFFNDIAGEVTSPMAFESNSPGMQFLQRCAIAYGTNKATTDDFENSDSGEWDGVTSDVMQNDMTARKEAIDVETLESLKFDKYEIGDVKIKNIACVFGNTMSKMSLKALDGNAPQYCGGQDTAIEVTIETRDEDAVGLLTLLPRMAAQYARDYRLVLPCWPLRLNSELTRMLGINEVLIESVDANTTPGYPGLFTVNIRMTAVDRTVRNKEALRKLEKYNPATGEMEPLNNAGSIDSGSRSTLATKNYFDLHNSLAQAELYPDLELPTLDDLRLAGFRFLRYSTIAGSRMYPDPDFYFVYAHTLGHEMIRSAIMNFSKQNTQYQISDQFGAALTVETKDKNGLRIVSKNDQAEAMSKHKTEVENMVKKIMLDRHADQYVTNSEIIDTYNNMEIFNTWDIAKTIRCMFREKKYSRFVDSTDPFMSKLNERIKKITVEIDKLLAMPIERMSGTPGWNDKKFVKSVVTGDQQSKLKDAVYAVYDDYIIGGDTTSFLYASETMASALADLDALFMAAADAASGEMEYSKDASKHNWQAKMYQNPEGVDINTATYGFDASNPNKAALIPYCRVLNTEQATVGRANASSLQEAVDRGVAFGPFQIKAYTKKEIEGITGKPVTTPGDSFFLDPYYLNLQMTKGVDCPEIQNYKRWIAMDMKATSLAFFRNVLTWMKYLLETGVLMSVFELIQDEAAWQIGQNANLDGAVIVENTKIREQILKDFEEQTKDMTDAEKAEAEKVRDEALDKIQEIDEQNTKLAEQVKLMLEDEKSPLARGRMFASVLMAITSGDQTIEGMMREQNYEQLNQLIKGAQLPTSNNLPILRKFVLALVGRDVISKMEDLGQKSETVAGMLGTIANEQWAIQAAEDPTQYILHSFYDMIINDKRGRMARAFPAYYMMFVDEGREIGLWKLHDNFYNMSAISEIQVTKSRKIAADTARITMSNMFKSYTNDDEDAKLMALDTDVLKNYQYTLHDAWNSIFSPRTYFLKEELTRMQAMPVERVQLKPGVRIHVRMGYGGDASKLPILFNGVVAEVGAGDTVEIVAQGDGVELTNPILSTSDAEDVQHDDSFVIGRIFKNWLTKGATPRTILGSLLTTKGGWLKKEIFNLSNGRFFNSNPYGIIHFGEPEYKEIFSSGEVVQNIYEGASKPSWFDEKVIMNMLPEEYSIHDAPKLSTQIFGKSFWDIMHICRSASPDYIASVVPFGLRSSVFFGAPRFYYAYEYAKEPLNQTRIKETRDLINQLEDLFAHPEKIVSISQGQGAETQLKEAKDLLQRLTAENALIVKEKRKPFQQYHIYNSYGDIIGNNIMASAKDVKTCAIGLYQSQGTFGRESMERVGPLWVDFDIYPEKQRTMTVDTQLVAKGTAVLGDIIPFYNWAQNQLADAKGSVQGGYEIAWRMTATALKDSVKDMYQGELIVVGDPSVKPYDKMWIDDMYENMQGCCEVEAVVHNFNVVDGYTTSIFADCISTIDDQYERVAQHFASDVVAQASAVYAGVTSMSYLFASRSRPFLTKLTSYATKSGKLASSAVDNIASMLGKEGLSTNDAWLKNVKALEKKLGLNTTAYKYNAYLNDLDKWRDTVKNIDSTQIRTVSELSSYFDNMGDVMKKVDPTDLINDMEKAKIGASNSQIAKLQNGIDELNGYKSQINSFLSNSNVSLLNDAEIDKMIFATDNKLTTLAPDSTEYKTLSAARDALESSRGLNSADELKDMSRAVKVIGQNVDNIDTIVDVSKLADSTSRMAGRLVSNMTKVDEVKDAIRTSKTIIKGAKLMSSAGKLAIAGIAMSAALEIAVTTVITSFALEYIERWMRNMQVLQVFPLKKNGVVMTAGLNGSKGIVVGSPSESDGGLMDKWIGNLFDKDQHGMVFNFVRDYFATSEMDEIAANFRKRNGVPEPGTTAGNEDMVHKLLEYISSDEMKTQQKGYNAMLMVGRVKEFSSAKDAYRKYAITDASTVTINTDIRENMIPIQENKRIREAIDAGYVKIMHMIQPDLSLQDRKLLELDGELDNYNNRTMQFTLNGVPTSIGVITTNAAGGGKIHDLPFLRPDAFFLLDRIITKVEDTYKVKSDNWKYVGSVQQHPVIIHSALRVGENKWNSTGFGFRVEVVDSDLTKILDEVQKEYQDQMIAAGKIVQKFFEMRKVTDSMYDVMVYPPSDGYPTNL